MANNAVHENANRPESTFGGSSLSDKITALSGSDAARLRAEWRKLYRTEPPRLSRDLMIRAIAYKVQERVLGGLGAATKRTLRELARKLETDDDLGTAANIRLKPGAKLIREWHGRSHIVVVLDEGFEFDGKRYRSLSEIARAITGAHWSGPRFFGLRRPPKPFTSRGMDRHE